MLSSSSSGSSSGDRRRPAPPARAPGAPPELARDWLQACRARVQDRMARCSGPLEPLHGPVGLDDDTSDSRVDGWPDRLASAWSALRR